MCFFFFFFNDTATTEIYTLSLHDALPILVDDRGAEPDHLAHALRAVGDHGHLLAVLAGGLREAPAVAGEGLALRGRAEHRSEEHTSELQSRPHLVCRLLLEKKKANQPRLS